MPRQVKRRAEAISRDNSSDDEEPEQPPQRRQRRRSTSSEPSNNGTPASSRAGSQAPTTNQTTERTLVKKLVRLALATEYARTPLRRSDISAKIFKEASLAGGKRISFKTIFDQANKELQTTFGMEMEELPSKEKTTIKERRTQATQTKASQSSSSSKSWMLVSILPPALKHNPILMKPTQAPDTTSEAEYTALYTLILSLIMLNNSALPDSKLDRYLKRMNAETYTPLGNRDKVLQRMQKEGYIEKRRDTTSGEEVIEWVPGPRGKIEVGMEGVVGLVRTVYGYGAVELSRGSGGNARIADRNDREQRRRGEDSSDEENDDPDQPQRRVKIEEEDLHQKLSRSLGIRVGKGGEIATVKKNRDDGKGDDEREREREEPDDGQPGPSKRGGAQKGRPSQGRPAAIRGRRARDYDSDDSD